MKIKKPLREQSVVWAEIVARAAKLGLKSPYDTTEDKKLLSLRAENSTIECENQRICDKLVDREVIWNLGSAIQYLRAVQSRLGSVDIDGLVGDDELNSLEAQPGTAAETGAGEGFEVIEIPNGDFAWFKRGEPRPYGDQLPEGYKLLKYKGKWYVREEASFTDLKDEKSRLGSKIPLFDLQPDALEYAWDMTKLDTFSDEEDAWADCVEQNRLDTRDYDSEIYEHRAVTRWFGQRLRQQGETVVEILDFNVWGRTTTGQSAGMDGVVHRIAHEMEILAGQKYTWAEKDS